MVRTVILTEYQITVLTVVGRDKKRMNFQPGDVVYWVGHYKWSAVMYVDFGIVTEEFSNAVCADKLHTYDNRYINNIPYKEFPNVTEWHKLPKGWNYDTVLFNVDRKSSINHNLFKSLHITNPDDIKYALEKGYLVRLQDYDQTVPHSEVDKKLGWRIRKEHDNFSYVYPHVTLQKDSAFKTYAEAQAVIDAQEAEWKRQSELTDEEWSIEQIDHDLQRWGKIYSKSPEEMQRVRDFLLGMDKIEDIETRVFGGDFQWKYWKNKKWRTVVLD